MLSCVLSALEERSGGGSVMLITGLGVWLGSQPPHSLEAPFQQVHSFKNYFAEQGIGPGDTMVNRHQPL